MRVRSDIIDVYIFRRPPGDSFELLQLLRTDEPLKATWQPIMGHIEPGETALACALRELEEEVGLRQTDAAFLGIRALEQVHPYYLPSSDSIVLSPRFALEVARNWSPRLNHEHSAHRWVDGASPETHFMWPGQIAAVKEIALWLTRGDWKRTL